MSEMTDDQGQDIAAQDVPDAPEAVSDEQQDDAPQDAQPEGSTEGAQDAPQDEQPEVIPSFADAPPEDAPQESKPIREIRRAYRDATRKVKELEAKLQAKEAPQQETQPDAIGPKPTAEECDYDPDLLAEKLEAWTRKKIEVEARIQAATEAAKRQAQAWDEKVGAYIKRKSSLKLPDFDDAELEVRDTLSDRRMAIIIDKVENSENLIYALGKDKARLSKLAALPDDVSFVFELGALTKDLKTHAKKSPPPPERSIEGAAGRVHGSDAELERLRAAAARTGDYSEVFKYREKIRNSK